MSTTFEKDILLELGGDRADPAELENILLSHFRRSTQYGDDTLVYDNGEMPALELKYFKSGKLSSIRTGPGFRSTDLEVLSEVVRKELLTAGPTRVARSVMFSALPVTGYFRFRDDFQLLRVPDGAPRPDFAVGDHPLFLETSFTSSTDASVNNLRCAKREREIELLCNVFLMPGVEALSRSSRFHWVYEPAVDGTLTSKFRQGGYSFVGANSESEAFSEVKSIPPLAIVDTETYYAQRGTRVGQALTIPETFAESFELFHSLSTASKERFLRSSYWYQQSSKAWSLSRSIAIAALVSAIEALRPDPLEGEGLRQAFMKFVDHYVPGIPSGDRRRFYELRSAISHGGKLLHADEVAWGITMQERNEGNDMRLLSSIVRTALINWLFSSR